MLGKVCCGLQLLRSNGLQRIRADIQRWVEIFVIAVYRGIILIFNDVPAHHNTKLLLFCVAVCKCLINSFANFIAEINHFIQAAIAVLIIVKLDKENRIAESICNNKFIYNLTITVTPLKHHNNLCSISVAKMVTSRRSFFQQQIFL